MPLVNASPNNAILEVRDLWLAFGRQQVLQGVSLSVRRGESLSIVGPNGAGKTTLLKCLLGLLRGQSGSVELEGRPLAGYSRRELARRISYVPQAEAHAIPFTVEQFVLLGRYPYLSPLTPPRRADHEAARRAMELTGTAPLADRLLESLSGGERQKVLLAAAVAQGSPIMLLDEPTTFLDYHHQEEIARLLAELAAQTELTTIAVTHDVNRAALGSDRIVALSAGRIVLDGPPGELMKPDVLQAVFDSPLLLVNHPQTGVPMIVPREVVRIPR